jgi:hypothetical protein
MLYISGGRFKCIDAVILDLGETTEVLLFRKLFVLFAGVLIMPLNLMAVAEEAFA